MGRRHRRRDREARRAISLPSPGDPHRDDRGPGGQRRRVPRARRRWRPASRRRGARRAGAGVAPTIAATSFEAEAQRRPLDEVIEALEGDRRVPVVRAERATAATRSTWRPTSTSGSPSREADPSMGWITTFYMEHNWLLTMFAEELQDEIFGAQPFVLAPGSVNPSGRAIRHRRRHLHAVGPLAVRHRHLPRRLGAAEREDRGDDDGRGAAASSFPSTTSRSRTRGTSTAWPRPAAATSWPPTSMVPERRVSLMPPPHVVRPARRSRTSIASRSRRSCRSPPRMPAVGAAKRALELFEERLFDRVHVRHEADPERPGADPGATRQPPRRGRLRRDAAARHRDRIQAHADGVIDLDLLGPAAAAPRASRTSCAGAATSSARSCSRAARRCTTSTTSSSGSTATST